MELLDDVSVLVERFSFLMWTAEPVDFEAHEADFRTACREQSLAPREVVAAQSDETLALAIKNGFCISEAVQELLLVRYIPVFFQWFQHRLKAPIDRVEDLVHDLTVGLLEKRFRTYRPDEPLHGYLFIAARNLKISKLHRQRKDSAFPELGIAGAQPSAHDVAVEKELQNDILRQVGLLPADQREVMSLKLENHSPQEIAAKTKLPVKNVHRLLHKARTGIVDALKIHLPKPDRGRPRKPD